MLTQRVHPKTGKRVWALVSTSSGRPLKYFGAMKPSAAAVAKEERRVEFYKSHGKAAPNRS